MNILDLLTMSLRMFKARTMRTILTILGMGVGISAIIFLVSLGYGLQRTLLEKITTSDALSTIDVSRSQEDAPALSPDIIGQLQSIPGVDTVIPVLEMRGQTRISGVTLDAGVTISDPSYLKLEGLKFEFGTNFSAETNSVVITSGMAKAFQQSPDTLLGKSVSVALFLPKESMTTTKKTRREETRVELTTAFTISGIVKGDENLLYVPLGATHALTLPPATKLKVKGVSSDALNGIRQHVDALHLTASSISETIDQANKVFTAIKVMLMLFGIIALVVSAIGMFNTMTIALLERTEEIGIMKSIGAAPSSISLMFIMESTLMGFLGSLVGVLIGLINSEIINFLFNLVASNFGGEKVDLFYSPLWFIAAVIGFGAFVGFLTGVIPARNAAKTDALEALRYK